MYLRNGGKNLSPKRDIVQLQYKYVNRKVHADTDNKGPYNWSSTVLRRSYGRNHERERQQTAEVSIKTKFIICIFTKIIPTIKSYRRISAAYHYVDVRTDKNTMHIRVTLY
jgi:hypothetical protein